MRRIYTVVFYLMIPLIWLRLYWKGRRLPAYRERIHERFSLNQEGLHPVDVWVHAVSLGEVVAATPFIEALLNNHRRIMVTTMTPTGSQQVLRRFGTRVAHRYLPYDLPSAIRRFFKAIQPRVGVIMETELWPNLIDEARRIKLPLLLVNARLSDHAFTQYEKVRFFFKPILNQLTMIVAQSEQDAARFRALGALPEQVQVLGNMKFDLQVHALVIPDGPMLREQWGSERTVVMAASTHDDEERQLLMCLPALKEAISNVLLLITPRHPERFQTVYQQSVSLGFHTGRRSQLTSIDKQTDVVVIDALGELIYFYQLSHYAFVGGSLVPIGGHNVLEPIAMNVPVFCGPYMQNSKSICDELCAARAMMVVSNAQELVVAIKALYEQDDKRQAQISRASAVLAANQGAVKRYVAMIESILLDSAAL